MRLIFVRKSTAYTQWKGLDTSCLTCRVDRDNSISCALFGNGKKIGGQNLQCERGGAVRARECEGGSGGGEVMPV